MKQPLGPDLRGKVAATTSYSRTPFGGSKRSGIVREGGVYSLKLYTELRNVCVKL